MKVWVIEEGGSMSKTLKRIAGAGLLWFLMVLAGAAVLMAGGMSPEKALVTSGEGTFFVSLFVAAAYCGVSLMMTDS